MALFAKLEIQNQSFNVVSTQCNYARKHNSRMPTTTPRCESITITLVAPEKRNPFLYEWYADKNQHSGKIVYDLGGLLHYNQGDVRELEFTEAGCLSLKETYDISDTQNQRIITLVIAPELVIIDNVNI